MASTLQGWVQKSPLGRAVAVGVAASESFAERLASKWNSLNLASRFAVASAVVIFVGMAVLGTWVNHRIQSAVVQNSAANVALYLVGFIEPNVQEVGAELPQAALDEIDAVYRRLAKHRNFIGLKVWAPGGRLVYASDKARQGQVFPESDELRSAWQGNIEPEFNKLAHAESELERKLNTPLLEVYVPMRSAKTKEVVAVAEVYEVATKLDQELTETFFKTSLVLGSIALLMFGSLANIVANGSRTIEQQRADLSDRVEQLSRLLAANRELRWRLGEANLRAAQSNEQLLRRVGADLHDGPAQQIAFALLRLDALKREASNAAAHAASVKAIEAALTEGLGEIRSICAGIVLPELRSCTLGEAIGTAVRNHEGRTGTSVALSISDDLPTDVDLPLVTCIYRLVQEGLNNATRHAGGIGQRVEATIDGRLIVITVTDGGGGEFGLDHKVLSSKSGLGLRGLADRIHSIGGQFEVVSNPGSGTRLTATFDLNASNQRQDPEYV